MQNIENPADGILDRAQGCLLGQLAGDALGSLVEFQTPEQILREYPNGVRELADGGTWDTIAGQPTDDSEMALTLARMLVAQGRYDREAARKAYVSWLDSRPFDCGRTIYGSLRRLGGEHLQSSQANGAMMRISPLGVFGANYELSRVAEWARQDCAITHAHQICQQANALFTMAIAHAVRSGCDAPSLHSLILDWAIAMAADESLLNVIRDAAHAPPADYLTYMGLAQIAFGNALWQLLNAESLEAGVIDTVGRGGDTDTTAAIAGALLGAVWGRSAIPAQWESCVLNCRPQAGLPGVRQPRPERFWPVDALELAEGLLGSA